MPNKCIRRDCLPILTKREFIKLISKECRISEDRAKFFYNGFLNVIYKAASNGYGFGLEGFLNFYFRVVPERKHVDFRSPKEARTVPIHVRPYAIWSARMRGIIKTINSTTPENEIASFLSERTKAAERERIKKQLEIKEAQSKDKESDSIGEKDA